MTLSVKSSLIPGDKKAAFGREGHINKIYRKFKSRPSWQKY